MKSTGLFLFLIGLIGIVYGFFMNTTVELSLDTIFNRNLESVHNIGLLNTQQNVFIVSSSLLVTGLIIYELGVFLNQQIQNNDLILKAIKELSKKDQTS